MTNRAPSFLRLTAVAGATLLASGCAVFSPVQTEFPYIPADGVPLNIPGLDLRNLAVVTEKDGGPGVLVGQAVNNTGQAIQVSFGVGDGATSVQTTVAAYSGATLSDAEKSLDLSSVKAPPGALVQLTVTTAEAGRNVVDIPVLDRNRYYTSLPTPTSAPSSSTSPSASTSPSPSPSASSSG